MADCIGDLFPHRYRPARDDEGFALGHMLPCDSGQWLTTAHVFKVVKEQLAAKDAEIAQLRSENERLKELAGCAYQYIGAEGGEARILDALSAASEGKPFNTEHLLPYCPPETNEESNRETLLERQLKAENAALRERVAALEAFAAKWGTDAPLSERRMLLHEASLAYRKAAGIFPNPDGVKAILDK